jgi:predicted component of type VI protein secretion system
MNEITLEWQEAARIRREIIRDQQRSTYPGTVRLGRDPTRCDLLLSDPTVSGLHVEIFFNAPEQSFALRNLRYSNPPIVDGRQIPQGEALLSQGSTIYLGQVEINVVAVSLAVPNHGIAPTLLIPPPALATNQPAPNVVSYGLQCPNCHRVSPYDRLEWGCQWCGTSLAAASSVLMTPQSN